MKVSDYVVKFFVDRGVRDTFLVSGGGIMHLLDSIGRHPDLRYYCNYHEQACAVAAEGYARITGRPGVCFATVGPGGANALSGALGSWVDSIPLIVVVGQVRTDLIADYSEVRQVGPQEANIVAMAAPVTKYAVSVRDASRIRYELSRAWYEATSGRPGPVLVELPLDIQGADVDPLQLEDYSAPSSDPTTNPHDLAAPARQVVEALRAAKRPVLIPGTGIHFAGARELLLQLVERLQVPVLLPFTAKDLFPEDHPLQMGVFGGAGQRRANFTLQNSDCLIVLAAGLSIAKTGFNVQGFAPKARKIVVDIDPGQLAHQVLKPDLAIRAEVRAFLKELHHQLDNVEIPNRVTWLEAAENWKRRYPLMTPDYYLDDRHVNTYVFMDSLSEVMQPGEVLVTGNGMDVVSCYQAFKVKPGQQVIVAGWGSMGWDLPNAIGACIANDRKPTVCVTGDGSIQWNIQELLSIANNNLPLKIFVFNNRGYSSIRATQRNFFEGRLVGADATSGVINPDFRALAAAYRIGYRSITAPAGLTAAIRDCIAADGPQLCEVNVPPDQVISPKASAFRREDGTLESRPLEDMAPFLPRDEVWENMHACDDLFDGPKPERA